MEVDRDGLEVLDRSECMRLLRRASLGHVGINSGSLPRVLPVVYSLDQSGRILIRTNVGSKLDAAVQDAVVAFEVDDFDARHESGWSVVATGVAHTVDDPGAPRRLGARCAGGDGRVVAITPEMITGRRLPPAGTDGGGHREHP